MTTAVEAPVSEDEVISICQEVWGAFLGDAELVVHGSGPATDGPLVTGCVSIAGEWSGSLFAAESGSLSPAEISDAIGELTNMVGGAVKGMVPAPSRLSIPSVSSGVGVNVAIPGARLLISVPFVWAGQTARVSLWEG
jgi:chemotaxis protein CheX